MICSIFNMFFVFFFKAKLSETIKSISQIFMFFELMTNCFCFWKMFLFLLINTSEINLEPFIPSGLILSPVSQFLTVNGKETLSKSKYAVESVKFILECWSNIVILRCPFGNWTLLSSLLMAISTGLGLMFLEINIEPRSFKSVQYLVFKRLPFFELINLMSSRFCFLLIPKSVKIRCHRNWGNSFIWSIKILEFMFR